jgi:hypothetical protein
MICIPNLLLISGSGRKSGKTTLACAIIKQFASQMKIAGLKISPHIHHGFENPIPVFDNGLFKIFSEASLTSAKDSSKMLAAGSSEAFYIESTDKFLADAFQEFLKLIPTVTPIICESPALRKHVEPGVFLFLTGLQTLKPKTNMENILPLADKAVGLEEAMKPTFLSSLRYENSIWFLQP